METSENESDVGNAAAMREALVAVKKSIDGIGTSSLDCDPTILMAALTQVCARLSARIERVLSTPARQCDVGTAGEQGERWQAFCDQFDDDCTGCPCDVAACASYTDCFARWAQMPYAAEEGGSDGEVV